jgi:hypothetical protein
MSRRLARHVPATSAGIQFRAQSFNSGLEVAPNAVASPELEDFVFKRRILGLQFVKSQND